LTHSVVHMVVGLSPAAQMTRSRLGLQLTGAAVNVKFVAD